MQAAHLDDDRDLHRQHALTVLLSVQAFGIGGFAVLAGRGDGEHDGAGGLVAVVILGTGPLVISEAKPQVILNTPVPVILETLLVISNITLRVTLRTRVRVISGTVSMVNSDTTPLAIRGDEGGGNRGHESIGGA
jgi:hypothetical protein